MEEKIELGKLEATVTYEMNPIADATHIRLNAKMKENIKSEGEAVTAKQVTEFTNRARSELDRIERELNPIRLNPREVSDIIYCPPVKETASEKAKVLNRIICFRGAATTVDRKVTFFGKTHTVLIDVRAVRKINLPLGEPSNENR